MTKEQDKGLLGKNMDVYQLRPLFLGMLAVVNVLFYLSFVYSDVTWTTRGGIEFWNSLLSGKFRSFYSASEGIYISDTFGSCDGFVYSIFLYVIFAVWNLPLYLYERFSGGYALDTMLGIVWAKSISLPFLLGIIKLITKAGEKLAGDRFKGRRAIVMFFSSLLFFTPVLVMGQYDSISLFFIILGIYGFLSKNEKLFLTAFAVAVPLKMFALLCFVPLLLLSEKDIGKIVKKLCCGCSLYIVSFLFQHFYFYSSDYAATVAEGHLFSFIFQGELGIVYGKSSLFLLVYLLFCFWCLFKKVEEERLSEWAVYVCFASFSLFFLFSLTHPQWSLLLLPFIVLLIGMREYEEGACGVLIETVMEVGLFIAQIMYYEWVFHTSTLAPMPIGRLLLDGRSILQGYASSILLGPAPKMGADKWTMAGGGIFAAGLIFMLAWTYPDIRRDKFSALVMPKAFVWTLRMGIYVLAGLLLYSTAI